MKSQEHKSATDDGKAKARPGIKASPQGIHPILQLQRTIGNKAVTNLIPRVRRNVPVKVVTPGTIQRHLADEQSSQADGASQAHSASSDKAAEGLQNIVTNTESTRAGAFEMFEAFSSLRSVVDAAAATAAPAEEGSAPTSTPASTEEGSAPTSTTGGA